jgi:pilus assembly protein Flp/PilA
VSAGTTACARLPSGLLSSAKSTSHLDCASNALWVDSATDAMSVSGIRQLCSQWAQRTFGNHSGGQKPRGTAEGPILASEPSMSTSTDIVRRFVREESGASMVEYSIVVGLISAASIALIAAVGAWCLGRWQFLQAAFGP